MKKRKRKWLSVEIAIKLISVEWKVNISMRKLL